MDRLHALLSICDPPFSSERSRNAFDEAALRLAASWTIAVSELFHDDLLPTVVWTAERLQRRDRVDADVVRERLIRQEER